MLVDLCGCFFVKGIEIECLVIFNLLLVLEYFDMYNWVDFCFDLFLFNGGIMGFDLIWMGVFFVIL